MTMRVAAVDEGSRVDVLTQLTLTGRAARMGGGLVEDVAKRFVADMAVCLKRKLADGPSEGAAVADVPPSARPVSGIRLLLRVFLNRLRGGEPKGET